MNVNEIRDRVALDDRLSAALSRQSFRSYLDRVVVNSVPPTRFGRIEEPWQRELNDVLVPAIEFTAGLRTDYNGPRSFYRELPRGHDKSSGIARVCNWLLNFSRRKLTFAVAATDQEQAQIITEAMKDEARLNPWLESKVSWSRNRVSGPSGFMKVLSCDAPSAWGGLYDFVICDELTHWPDVKEGSVAGTKGSLFHALITGREKRPNSIFYIITNAGVLGTWQDELRKQVTTDPTWNVFVAPGHMASWMTAEAVNRLRRLVPDLVARRVFDNEWIDPAEAGGYLKRADVLGCEDLGRVLGLSWSLTGGHDVPRYYAGIDYGPKKDRTALSVVHRRPDDGLIIVDRLDIMQGTKDVPVLIDRVEDWIDDINKRFHFPTLVVDPYQMEGTIQKYEGRQRVVRFETRGGKSNYEMARTLQELVVNRRLVWYPGAGYVADGDDFSSELLQLVIKVMSYGYRFDHTARHHDDRAVSVGMAALEAARNVNDVTLVPGNVSQVQQSRGLWGGRR